MSEEQLNRLEIRVRAGQSITAALDSERLRYAFYGKLDRFGRMRIAQARREYLDQQRGSRDRARCNQLHIILPADKHTALADLCASQNISVSRCINSLVSSYLEARRAV